MQRFGLWVPLRKLPALIDPVMRSIDNQVFCISGVPISNRHYPFVLAHPHFNLIPHSVYHPGYLVGHRGE